MSVPATFTKDDIKQVECRFAVHCSVSADQSDLHLIKKAVKLNDGRVVPSLGFVREMKRPFWITKPGARNYKDHKEWIDQSQLDVYHSTQTKLTNSVARALKKFNHRGLRSLCAEPYVFGVDISSTSIIKHEINKNAETTSYSVSVYDTEVDVVHGTDEVIINTLSFKDKIYTAVKRSFVAGYSDPLPEIERMISRYIGDKLKQRNATVEVEIFDTEIEIIKACIKRAHDWMPDFIAVWNIEYDMDKIVAACEKSGTDIAELLSHPSVPKEFKHFKFTKGPAKKVTASGRVINFKPSQRWHDVDVPSASKWIDAMQVYRQVRTGSAEEPSYALDAILKKHKLDSKLKFHDLDDNDAPESNTLAWHVFMQSKYPIHYIVYNIFDCVAVELLDEKTLDMSLSMPMFAGCSDFARFNSLPKKTIDALHWRCLEQGKVIGATANEIGDDMDEETADVTGWIVMLHPHQVIDNGLCVIEENPNLRTNIRTHGADLDVAGAYPTNESCMNVSKETTKFELIAIYDDAGEKIPDEVVRTQTINFSGGKTNSLEFCQTIFGMPDLDRVLEHYDAATVGTIAPTPVNPVARFLNWIKNSRGSQDPLGW